MNNWDGICVSGVDCVCADDECKDACWITTLGAPQRVDAHEGEKLAKGMGDLGIADPFGDVMERTLSG